MPQLTVLYLFLSFVICIQYSSSFLFEPNVHRRIQRTSLQSEKDTEANFVEEPESLSKLSKGFGKKALNTKSNIQTEQEKAAKEYEKLRDSGVPVYNIFTRTCGSKQWLPVGSMAIPRTSKPGDVIYNSEENLKRGAFELFPSLEKAECLEYGYNLKIYPDEEIRLAEKSNVANSNILVEWLNSIMNPLDSSSSSK